jgi:TetR/AcrR family transcriptional regulator
MAGPVNTTPTRKAGRPRGGSSDCRARLLGAATTLFAERGYDGLSLRQLAAAAHCDVSMVAHHFGGKAGLWRAVIDDVASRLNGELDCATVLLHDRDTALAARVEEGIHRLFDALARVHRLAPLVLRELHQPGERGDYVEERILKPAAAVYAPLWREAMEGGLLARTEPLMAHFALTGAILMLVTTRPAINRLGGRPLSMEALQAEFIRALTTGTRGMPAASGSPAEDPPAA